MIHPDFSCPALGGISVCVARRPPSRLDVVYRVVGELERLRIPASDKPVRTDELWRHTCFELFVRTEGDGYLEFNLSPSGQWAAYRFSGYREGMEHLEIATPEIAWRANAHGGELSVTLDNPGVQLNGARMALTAVIETVEGDRSYWSLAHAPGRPDFHHPASFAAEFPTEISELEPR